MAKDYFTIKNSGNIIELFYSERSFLEALNKKEFPIEDPPSIFTSARKLLEKPGDHLNLFSTLSRPRLSYLSRSLLLLAKLASAEPKVRR